MLGCENMASAATLNTGNRRGEVMATMVSGDACASAQSHDCCAKHRARLEVETSHTKSNVSTDTSELIGNSAPSMIDCPLALNATAAISKPGSDQASVAVVTVNASDPVHICLRRGVRCRTRCCYLIAAIPTFAAVFS